MMQSTELDGVANLKVVGVGGGGVDVAGTARATRGAPVGVGLAGATSRCTTFGAGGAGV